MNKNLKKIIKYNGDALKNSDKTLKSVFEIMFSFEENILCEFNDGFLAKKLTYGQVKKKILSASGALYQKIGANGCFVALEAENSPEWIIGFWAILASGNKPYLVNTRYPQSLTEKILKTLEIKYILSDKQTALAGENILISSLAQEARAPEDVFADEIAFSSSATSMNEVICFYSGYQISEQILNFEGIIKLNPDIAKHYKGSLKQLAFLPFYHVFGLFAVYFWFTFFGRTLVFLRDYSAQTILKTVKKHQVTHIFAPPVLWHTIEKQVFKEAKAQDSEQKLMRGLKLSLALQNAGFGCAVSKRLMKQVTSKVFGNSVMFCINGGAYLKDSALYLLNGIGYNMHNGYGMSEIGITSVDLSRKVKDKNLNSIGKPFDSVEYKLDENGILLVKGTMVCTKKLVNGVEQEKDDWFYTGDNMKKDESGNYYILGRQGDVVIGENGENINPDLIEKAFDIPFAAHFSVLGLDKNGTEALTLIVETTPYLNENSLNKIKQEVYKINDTLPSASRVKDFYFTFDALCPQTAIKVSRTQLKHKLACGEVKLISFNEMTPITAVDESSPLFESVRNIIAKELDVTKEEIMPQTHLFNDLGATSIQYFSCIAALAEEFSIDNYNKSDSFCYTVKEICEYIERRLNE